MLKDDSRELAATFAVENPIGYLNKARQNRDYFLFFALAVSYFEFYGYQILRKFHWDNVPDDFKNNDRLTAYPIILQLDEQKVVKKKTFDKMKKINQKRNSIVHSKTDIHLKYEMDDEGRVLMENAIEIVEKLKIKYDPIQLQS